MDAPRIIASGPFERTLLFPSRMDPAQSRQIRQMAAAIRSFGLPGLVEVVPGYATLHLEWDPLLFTPDLVDRGLTSLQPKGEDASAPRHHRLPVAYGGPFGPDLGDVATGKGLTEETAARLHASQIYDVHFLGFSPGFPYMGELPEALGFPRLEMPRIRVPEGSVGVAGRQTGIYPVPSPGGWRLVGRTPVRLFRPEDEADPFLILPGDRVSFLPIPQAQFQRLMDDRGDTPPPVLEGWGLRVLDSGLLTHVQDAGRRGHHHLGVSTAGASDGRSLILANHLVGNDPTAAGLEMTVTGVTVQAQRDIWAAVVGTSDGQVFLNDQRVPPNQSLLLAPGDLLRIPKTGGARAYLAVQGGVDVPRLLGSRSTDLMAGFGGFQGRSIKSGDVLPVGFAFKSAYPRTLRPEWVPTVEKELTIEVMAGPQSSLLGTQALEAFLGSVFSVSPHSDSVGVRLSGGALSIPGLSLLSEGQAPGSIQVPPSGQPIILLGGRPTVGGYPKIAVSSRKGLADLAQTLAGQRIRFRLVPEASLRQEDVRWLTALMDAEATTVRLD